MTGGLPICFLILGRQEMRFIDRLCTFFYNYLRYMEWEIV